MPLRQLRQPNTPNRLRHRQTVLLALPICCVIACCWYASPAVRAGAVLTSDGSRLVGRIQGMSEGKLVIITEIAGRLEIDTTKIVAIESDEPLIVEFASGDRLVGTIGINADGKSVIHTAMGDLSMAVARIEAAWLPGQDSPEVIALRRETERVRKELTPEWFVTLEAGGTRKEGNTNTLDARGRLDVVRKTGKDLLNFYLAANYSEQNNRRSQNEYRGGIKYEQMITERWNWYTRVEMEFDEFENLDLRSTVAAGVGYYWIRKPDHEFKTRVGLGYRHESYNNGVSNDEAVIDLGFDYRRDLAPWLQLTHAMTISPGLEETDNYRLDVDTALVVPFQMEKVKLKLGMRNEYNSRPQGNLDRLDNTYYVNLVFALKPH